MNERKKPLFPPSRRTFVIFVVVVMLTIASTFVYRVTTHGIQ